MPKQFKIKLNDKAYNIQFEKYENISALDKSEKEIGIGCFYGA